MRLPVSLLILACLSCSQERKQTPSDEAHKETSTYHAGLFDYGTNRGGEYFPAFLYDHVDTVARHAFGAHINASILHKNREPDLCSKYSGKDVIRAVFTSAFTFHHHLVVNVVNENGNYYVTEKESYEHAILVPKNKSGLFYYLEYDSILGSYQKVGYDSKPLMEGDNWVERSREPIDPVISEKRYEATQAIWNEAIRRLNEGYFLMEPSAPREGLDGTYILVETHFADGYYAVERHSPRPGSPLASVSDYLFLLCGQWGFTSDRSRFRSLPDSLLILKANERFPDP